ncbi:hypothetical protein BH11MYX4_BH11MYX4_66720 [soil metagenome]
MNRAFAHPTRGGNTVVPVRAYYTVTIEWCPHWICARPATLSFPCAGGAATARFSSQTFSGTADPKKVQISNTTVFPFSGCQVRAIQTISGTPPNLSYFYSESIVSGKCPGTTTCTARGSVSAQ